MTAESITAGSRTGETSLETGETAVHPEARGHHPDVEHVGLVQQAIRYFGTGVMSAVVDFGLLLILMAVGVGYTPAKAASFIVGTITAYSLNRRFTFKAQPSRRRFILTMLTYVVTFALQVGIFAKLFPLIAQEHLPRLAVQTISFVFGQGAATVANFSMQRWLIFRPTQAPVREAASAVD
ncbi:GtrA family protein [Raineyella fluvialis]|uniref:GtrA family protein n=1 Tax=Raineyella fluvialis TaxID=2662261 RepID=A0A5Q2FAV1_9ACTN|nr:GtrA family protein [Raineyella fluvialis]QGF22504.1 GtrA family protein [Raineyella fluvialis]